MANYVPAKVSELQLYKGCTFRINFILLNDTTGNPLNTTAATTYKVINYNMSSGGYVNTGGYVHDGNVIVRKVN